MQTFANSAIEQMARATTTMTSFVTKANRRPTRTRLMDKVGRTNLTLENVPALRQQLLALVLHISHTPKRVCTCTHCSDIFNTVMEWQWRWCVFIFSASFLLSWYIFACLYSIEPWLRGDFAVVRDDPAQSLCIASCVTFVDFIMFSVETQASIGYGFRLNECVIVVIDVQISNIQMPLHNCARSNSINNRSALTSPNGWLCICEVINANKACTHDYLQSTVCD
jgi:hypothetical protein